MMHFAVPRLHPAIASPTATTSEAVATPTQHRPKGDVWTSMLASPSRNAEWAAVARSMWMS